MSDCPKCLNIPGDFAHTCDKDAPSKPEMIEVPVLDNTFPVVLYLGSEEDREGLIQALMEVNPGMRSRKLN